MTALEGRELLAQDEISNLKDTLGEIRESHELIAAEKARLEDRIESAITDKERLWNLMECAQSEVVNSLKMQVNHISQRSGGGVAYPEAGQLSPELERKPQKAGPVGRSARAIPSQQASLQRRNFAKNHYNPPVQEVES